MKKTGNTLSDIGWQSFLKGLKSNDADLIEEGMQFMAHAACPDPKSSHDPQSHASR